MPIIKKGKTYRHPFSKAKILSGFGALVGVSFLVIDGYLAKIMAIAVWNTTIALFRWIRGLPARVTA
ncbi:MAG: hypothetical protein PVF59_05000 [Desulfobacterales bacterium]|jgi:hypothetical protein